MPNPSPATLQNQAKILLQINSDIFSGFLGLTVSTGIDRCSNAFSFSVPNDGKFKLPPFSIPTVKVLLEAGGRETIITGYIEQSTYAKQQGSSAINFQGRSASGVLNDYSAGPPFQFEDLTFNEFCTEQYKSLDPSANAGVASAKPNTAAISEIAFNVGENAYSVLTDLAAAHNLFPVPTESGRIEYRKLAGSGSFASLEDGQGVVRSVQTKFDVSKRFEEYIVIATYNGQQSEEMVKDFEILGLEKRGRKIVELKQESTDITHAAKSLRQAALLDSFSCTVQVDGWHYQGKAWKPGEIVTLSAPDEQIKNNSRLMIRECSFQLDDSQGQSTTLNLCLPEVYTGKEVRGDFPWVF